MCGRVEVLIKPDLAVPVSLSGETTCLLPLRRWGDGLGWSPAGVRSAAVFEPADRPDGHILVAEHLAR